jgi:N-acetylglucosamine kinase-like BadF-type ATPase
MADEERPVVVGVDAGGTATAIAVGGAGEIREIEGPGANATTLGVDDAADAIVTQVRRALERERVAAIAIGATGAGRPEIAETLRSLVAAAFPHARVVVAHDAAIALRASIPAGPGLVLVAGTGSVAYAENGERRVLVGGLGHVAGDEGSGFAIGMAAVRFYGRILDGRARADALGEVVGRELGAASRDRYLQAIYEGPLPIVRIAALAPQVIALASAGERSATRIVQEAAKELGDLTKSAAVQAGLVDAAPAVAFAGGVLRENSLLTFLLETRIVGDLPGAAIVRGGASAALGALRIAAALAAHG